MSISSQLATLAAAKSAIRSAIVAKGVAITDSDTFSGYADKIAAIISPGGADGWARPSDWLTMPNVTNTEEKFIGLYAVLPTDSNFIAITFQGNFTVNWGDGSAPQDFTAGASAEHIYNYDTIPSTYSYNGNTQSTACSLGYKQVVVIVTPLAGQNLTVVNINKQHSQSGLSYSMSSGWLDILFSAPHLTQLQVSAAAERINHRFLERFRVISTHSVKVFSYMFQNCYALQALQLDTTDATDFGYMFRYCQALKTIPLLDSSKVTNFTGMFQSCISLQSIPNLDTSNGTNFTNMFNGCSLLKSVPALNTAAASASGFAGMFNLCAMLYSVGDFSVATGTTLSNIFNGCYNLQACGIKGAKVALTLNGKMSAAALEKLFNNLGTASGTQTLTISGNWGYPLLTQAQKNIAISKGWGIA